MLNLNMIILEDEVRLGDENEACGGSGSLDTGEHSALLWEDAGTGVCLQVTKRALPGTEYQTP